MRDKPLLHRHKHGALQNSTDPGGFFGAPLTIDPVNDNSQGVSKTYNLRLKDGTTYVLSGGGLLMAEGDRHGHQITGTRTNSKPPSGPGAKLTSPNGRGVNFTH